MSGSGRKRLGVRRGVVVSTCRSLDGLFSSRIELYISPASGIARQRKYSDTEESVE